MPRFVTRAELDARWGRDRLRELVLGPGGTAVEERLDQALADSEAEAVSYLSGRYPSLPDAPAGTPTVLKARVGDLFLYHLLRLTGHAIGEQDRETYAAAVRWLRDVAAGRANLDLAGSPPEDESRPDILMARRPDEAVFAGGGLEEW